MDLLALSAFNDVARHGGFGRASRETGQAKATLSRRVRDLEDELGIRLIERGVHALRLTDEGATLHARTTGPLHDIDEAAADLAAGLTRPRGVLRISAPVLFSHVAMGRVAAGFIATYKEVTLDVVAEDRMVDAVDDRFDVIIRINPRPDQELIGRCFFRDETLLIAPPGLTLPAEAATIPAVLLHGAATTLTWHRSDTGPSHATLHPVLVLPSLLEVRDATRAGAGAALLPRSLVAADLAAGTLVEWGRVDGRAVEGWVLHLSRRLMSPKVSAFVTYLCEAFPDGVFRV